MEDQLISFETAKLAREKGFMEFTNKVFNENGKQYIFNNGLLSGSLRFNAPTQSLLQKWLREKHNIQLCLQPIYGGNKIEGKQTGWLCYTPYNDEKFNNLPSISLSEYSYEEALEKGLQQALKLIR